MPKVRPEGSGSSTGAAGMDVPQGIADLLRGQLAREGVEEAFIIVDVAFGITSKNSRFAFLGSRYRNSCRLSRRAVAQPLLDGQPVALGLADLLALLVEEQLVGQILRWRPVL